MFFDRIFHIDYHDDVPSGACAPENFWPTTSKRKGATAPHALPLDLPTYRYTHTAWWSKGLLRFCARAFSGARARTFASSLPSASSSDLSLVWVVNRATPRGYLFYHLLQLSIKVRNFGFKILFFCFLGWTSPYLHRFFMNICTYFP